MGSLRCSDNCIGSLGCGCGLVESVFRVPDLLETVWRISDSDVEFVWRVLEVCMHVPQHGQK